MAYLSSHRGDYLGSYRGDPGFFKSLLKGIGKVAGVFLGGGAPAAPTFILPPGYRPPSQRQPPSLQMGGPFGLVYRRPRAAAGRAGLVQGKIPGSPEYSAYMAGQRKRKRMNVANPKALRRAIRRQSGFVKLARRALKGSGYRIVTASSRKPSIRIQESGPGGVTVQK